MEMESYIITHGSATMQELCEQFDVSINTARRDIEELLKQGNIRKVYGGVRAEISKPALIPYAVRAKTSNANKRAIGQLAARMVQDGDIIFIDSGTTTMYIMEGLKEKRITIITNNIEVMFQALECENIRLMMLPGEVHRKTNSIAGDESAAYLSHFNTNIAFMAATGASMTGVTNSSPVEYAIKKEAVFHTEKAVLMVTGDKFGKTSLLSYAALPQFHTVITDSGMPEEYQSYFEKNHVEIQTAGAAK